MKKPSFTYRAIGNYLVIWDECKEGHLNVQSGIAFVLEQISKNKKIVGKRVIFRGNNDEYNEVLIDKNGQFVGFENPAKRELMVAICKEILGGMPE